jgi:hypothetical protein
MSRSLDFKKDVVKKCMLPYTVIFHPSVFRFNPDQYLVHPDERNYSRVANDFKNNVVESKIPKKLEIKFIDDNEITNETNNQHPMSMATEGSILQPSTGLRDAAVVYAKWKGLYTRGEIGCSGTRVWLHPLAGQVYTVKDATLLTDHNCDDERKFDEPCDCDIDDLLSEFYESDFLGDYVNIRDNNLDDMIDNIMGNNDNVYKTITIEEMEARTVEGLNLNMYHFHQRDGDIGDYCGQAKQEYKIPIVKELQNNSDPVFIVMYKQNEIVTELEQVNTECKAKGVLFHWM